MLPYLCIPLLPLIAVLLILVSPPAKVHTRAKLAILPMAAAFVLSILALGAVVAEGSQVMRFYDPSAIANPALALGFQLDRLSCLMLVVISGIGTLIFRYAITYMFQDPGYRRFLALVCVTTTVLLVMAGSVNLVMLFVCWQLLGYLLSLLAHNLTHGPTYAGSLRTFRFLRLGDAAFLAGIVVAHALYGTLEFEELFTRAAARPVSLSPVPGLDLDGATAVTLLIFVGIMSKSAQFPLHVWVPHSLYAPTPVHALLHAGIINAGGFLMNRLAPLFAISPTTLHAALIVGIVTAGLGAVLMLTQNDIKKTLGFSTMGQMGYMVMECGLGAFALAVFHMIAHGIFKATVFLNCGNVIHKARAEPFFPSGPSPEPAPLSRLSWATGAVLTLVLPLLILLVAHGILRIPLADSHGTVVFLFFIWITTSQAVLTLTRLRAVASWKVSATMLLILLAVVFTYLFAAERFTEFLYPDPAMVQAHFRAAAIPAPLFEGLVVLAALLVLVSWTFLYARSHGGAVALPAWVEELRATLYVAVMNHCYLDALYARAGRALQGLASRLDDVSLGKAP